MFSVVLGLARLRKETGQEIEAAEVLRKQRDPTPFDVDDADDLERLPLSQRRIVTARRGTRRRAYTPVPEEPVPEDLVPEEPAPREPMYAMDFLSDSEDENVGSGRRFQRVVDSDDESEVGSSSRSPSPDPVPDRDGRGSRRPSVSPGPSDDSNRSSVSLLSSLGILKTCAYRDALRTCFSPPAHFRVLDDITDSFYVRLLDNLQTALLPLHRYAWGWGNVSTYWDENVSVKGYGIVGESDGYHLVAGLCVDHGWLVGAGTVERNRTRMKLAPGQDIIDGTAVDYDGYPVFFSSYADTDDAVASLFREAFHDPRMYDRMMIPRGSHVMEDGKRVVWYILDMHFASRDDAADMGRALSTVYHGNLDRAEREGYALLRIPRRMDLDILGDFHSPVRVGIRMEMPRPIRVNIYNQASILTDDVYILHDVPNSTDVRVVPFEKCFDWFQICREDFDLLRANPRVEDSYQRQGVREDAFQRVRESNQGRNAPGSAVVASGRSNVPESAVLVRDRSRLPIYAYVGIWEPTPEATDGSLLRTMVQMLYWSDMEPVFRFAGLRSELSTFFSDQSYVRVARVFKSPRDGMTVAYFGFCCTWGKIGLTRAMSINGERGESNDVRVGWERREDAGRNGMRKPVFKHGDHKKPAFGYSSNGENVWFGLPVRFRRTEDALNLVRIAEAFRRGYAANEERRRMKMSRAFTSDLEDHAESRARDAETIEYPRGLSLDGDPRYRRYVVNGGEEWIVPLTRANDWSEVGGA